MKLQLNYDELTNCMRCGFCQPACPTFKETGLEAASPRGRIALMKAVVDGVMEPDQAFQDQMDLCLGCRACEPVCPADVKYGSLLEQTRDAIAQTTPKSWLVRQARATAFKRLFPHPKRVRRLGGLLRFYQKSGLQSLARASGAMRLFPAQLRQMERIMPETSGQGVVERIGAFHPARGERVARVGLFRGCIMDMMFAGTNVNTVELLTAVGFEVVIPETQTCCGALHAHSGELDDARTLARRNISAFLEAGVDYIVSNAGGCGALLVEYGHLLQRSEDPDVAKRAAWFAERTKDVSQLVMEKGNLSVLKERLARGEGGARAGRSASGGLTDGGPSGDAAEIPDTSAASVVVTYQDSCHLRNVMRAGNAPRDVLGFVPGATFRELKGADTCCGSAGIYNLLQPDMANDILEHKMEHVRETRAQVLLTSNPGCLLQMKAGIERAGLSGQMEAMHVVDFVRARLR
ncbi:(Fe-S)-binding protein [Paenibacillus sp. TRM 82003]|nr:(Fe-S)-binding protein [Paenibacillus sp. TRM 82003]